MNMPQELRKVQDERSSWEAQRKPSYTLRELKGRVFIRYVSVHWDGTGECNVYEPRNLTETRTTPEAKKLELPAA